MSSRYTGRKLKQTTVDDKMYKKLLDEREVKKIRHYDTPVLSHPSVKERENLTQHIHVWKVGDRYYKLAHQYYGDSRYWWVIAQWNLKPTEAHLNIGDSVRIPGPIERALSILKRQKRVGGAGY